MKLLFVPLLHVLYGTKIGTNLRIWVGLVLLAFVSLVVAKLGLDGAMINPTVSDWCMNLAIVCLLVALYWMGGIYYLLSPDLVTLARAVKRIGTGDLTSRAEGAGSYDGRRIAQHLQESGQGLIEIVKQVRASSDAITGGATEIVSGNMQLSRRTEEQASTLEQVSAGIEELSSAARQNSDNCSRASELAESASMVAAQAVTSMHKVVDVIGDINRSAKKIVDINTVVEGIAFQTHILALNAAVEAARAGELGRGFAVVASEVRSLAQRSSTAAKEIKDLIAQSVTHSATATVIVTEAEQTIHAVVDSVQQTQQLIVDIADASRDQSNGVAQINRAIAQLDDFSQHNAALVEEATATTLAFEQEATRLSDVVGKFKLDHMEGRDQAVALVKRAIAHLHMKGAEVAYRDFATANGPFMFDEFYVYVLGLDGHVHLHPTLRGNNMELADSDGKKFFSSMIQTVQAAGKGWEDYRWNNPVSHRIEQKSVYFERYKEVLIACGIYTGEKKHAPRNMSTPAPVTANNIVAIKNRLRRRA